MIVEDSDDIRELLEALLSNEGHQVNAFSNGPEALALLTRPEVIYHT